MASIKLIRDTFDVYKKWVMNNPTRATEMETLAKWLSYVVAGKVNKSPIFSELIYSLSNLFTFYNDMLIRQLHDEGNDSKSTTKDRLKLCLTIIHYCEVFVEITSRNKWGNSGKWNSVTAIQIVRCVLNLILIHRYEEIPLQQPPIPILQRSRLTEDVSSQEFNQEGFVLKRSGRVIRRVEAALPIPLRDWKPINVTIQKETHAQHESKDRKRFAETLHAIKPLAHLGSIAYFGAETWKQWLVYLFFDMYSLHLYKNEMNSLSYGQRLEINRRKLGLVLYILRTPMYQKHTSPVIHKILNGMANKIPLCGLICKPILQHLPGWQDTYFYMWPY